VKTATAEIRSSTKWLLTAFAAVGAVLIAGTQLSSLGDAVNPLYLFVASLGLVAGLAGVAWALWLAIAILAPHHLTLKILATPSNCDEWKDIRTFLNSNQGIFRSRATDLSTMNTYYSNLVKEHYDLKNIAMSLPKIQTTPRQEIDWHLRVTKLLLEIASLMI
jgi:hypothetical protein